MTIIASHITALHILRLPSVQGVDFGTPLSPAQARKALATTRPDAHEAATLAKRHRLPDDEKIHCLIPCEDARTRSSRIACHTAPSKLPPHAIRQLANGDLVCSPEFVFTQMASRLPLAQAVALGFELTGSYRLDEGEGRSFRQRPPIATESNICRFSQTDGLLGARATARTAERYVVEGSASPMETITAIPLALPRRYGGYGLPAPQMNRKIALSSKAQRACGRSYLVADLFWPQFKISVEYNSTRFHTGSEKIDSDARRQTALVDAGVQVVEVTAAQALSTSGMDAVAAVLAKRMGIRIRPEKSWRAAQRAMRSNLLAWHGFKPESRDGGNRSIL